MRIRKTTFAVCLAIALAAVPAQAQVLKKLGKAVEKVAGVKKSDSTAKPTAAQGIPPNLGKQIGETVRLGEMLMSAYGNNPGLGFNFATCYRENGVVVLAFQLPNRSGADVENVWIRNYEKDATEAYGADGSKYKVALMAIGESRSTDGLSANIPNNQYANALIALQGVPADAPSLGTVVIRLTGQRPMDSDTYRYSFVLQNVPITTPEAAQAGATAQQSHTRPEGGWMLTSEGVGPCKIGASLSDITAAVDGLFDKVDIDGDLCYVYLNGEQVMNLHIAAGKIVGITVTGQNVGVKVGAKVFKVGGDADLLKKQPGVKGVSYNDNADYNGIHFEGGDSEIQFISIGKIY